MSEMQKYETDTLPTASGELRITFLGHGSLLFQAGELNIYIDPFSEVADYSAMPKAGLVLLTHEHDDHLDPQALAHILTGETAVVMNAGCSGQVSRGTVLNNGQQHTAAGVGIRAVPAYNIIHHRQNGQPFHPKGIGNGYVLTVDGLTVYVAGDTENTPEMKSLRGIDIAFLPMNLPYTMTPEMVADAARAIRPAVLYPYHFGETDTARLVDLLKDEPEIEVRIRRMA